MKILVNNHTDPYFNLATEEYLLKNTLEDIIFLYRNSPGVIVGKHQNAMGEVNYRFIKENNIPLIRRISGGGTVYHDEGNINFTFIRNGEEGHLVNFRLFIEPIAEYLRQCGIPAEIGVRNDILVDGLKVSGNAEHIYKKRTLHHGTLLFSSNLDYLRGCLKTQEGKYTDRAVKSVRSKVSNLKPYVSTALTMELFYSNLCDFLANKFKAGTYVPDSSVIDSIKESAATKYSDWNWNYGYSPDYIFRNSISFKNNTLALELNVSKGIVKEADITGNIEKDLAFEIKNSLINMAHSAEALSSLDPVKKLASKFSDSYSDIIWFFF